MTTPQLDDNGEPILPLPPGEESDDFYAIMAELPTLPDDPSDAT